MIRKGFWSRRLTFNQLIQHIGLDVSARTLSRALRRLGYRRYIACRRQFINEIQAKKRLKWAHAHAHCLPNWWARVIWSDECSFETGRRGRIWITRRPNEIHCTDCI